jgi:hypothetical protein
VDIGKAIGFVFEDEEWVSKLLLGSAISLIPVFGWFAVGGYGMAVVRNVMAGESRPLPRWEDLGRFFMDGLMFGIAILIYTLPIWILVCPISVVSVLPALGGQDEDLVAILVGVSGVVSLALGCVITFYGLLLGLFAPAVQIRYAETGELGACLRIGELLRFLFDNVGSIIISQLALWVVGLIIGVVIGTAVTILILIPICGWILAFALSLLMMPVNIWLALFSAHLYGQIGRQAGVIPLMA